MRITGLMKSGHFCSIHRSYHTLTTGSTTTTRSPGLVSCCTHSHPRLCPCRSWKRAWKSKYWHFQLLSWKKRGCFFPSCGKFSKHENRVQMLGSQNRMTNIPYREISKKLPLMVKVQSPLRLGLRNLEKCLRSTEQENSLEQNPRSLSSSPCKLFQSSFHHPTLCKPSSPGMTN